MATITHEADKLLQATTPRLEGISNNYISISTNTSNIILRASGIASPSEFIATPNLNGQLRGIENLTWSINPSNITYSVNSTTKALTVLAQDALANTTITVTASLTYLGITYTKSASFSKQTNVASAELSTTNIVLPADSSGNILTYSGATTTMSVYVGNQDDSTNWTYSVFKSNVTTAEATTSRTQTITNLSANIGYVAITASKSGFDNITKTFVITKQTAGAPGSNGAPGSDGAPGSNGTNGILVVTAYAVRNQSDSLLTTAPANTTGITPPSGSTPTWSFTAPSPTVGQVVWYSFGRYNSNASTVDSIPANTTVWSVPVAASVFQDIRSDNWTGAQPTSGTFTSTTGYYLNKSEGSFYGTNVYLRGEFYSGTLNASRISLNQNLSFQSWLANANARSNKLAVINEYNEVIAYLGDRHVGSNEGIGIPIMRFRPSKYRPHYSIYIDDINPYYWLFNPGQVTEGISTTFFRQGLRWGLQDNPSVLDPFPAFTTTIGDVNASNGNISGILSSTNGYYVANKGMTFVPKADNAINVWNWGSNSSSSYHGARFFLQLQDIANNTTTSVADVYINRRPNLSSGTVSADTYALDIVTGVFRYGGVTIATPPNNTTQYLRADGTWQTVTSGTSYTLPLAANGTRGGVQIGYTQNARNYAVQLDANEKMYVNVPWIDTDTVYSLPLATNGTRGGVQIGFSTNSGARNYAVQLSGEQMYVNVPWTDTDTDTWIANSSSQAGYVASGSGQANKVWKTDGSGNPAWRDDSDTVYSLPLATNGTRGGVQIGYTQSGQNYPVQLSGEKMFVNVPWTDTNSGGTVISVTTGNGLTGGTIQTSGTIQMSGSYTGSFSATGEITAYSSDARLKTNIRTIDNAINKVLKLSGIIYNFNDLAETYGYAKHTEHVGLLAQDVYNVLPQAVALAPFDIKKVDGKEISKSGENYLTIKYEKLVALLVEAVKEQQAQIEELKQLIKGDNN